MTSGTGRRGWFGDLFEEGIAHFNDGRYWEAHESWEQLWLEAESDMHRFLQGLIQIAAAFHHLDRGNRRGAARLLEAAGDKLDGFDDLYAGLSAASIRHALDLGEGRLAAAESGNAPAERARLELHDEWRTMVPESW